MKRRMITSTLAVVLVVVTVFGVLLAVVETRSINSDAQDAVRADATRLSGVVESRRAAGERVDVAALHRQVGSGRGAVVRVPGKKPVRFGEVPEAGEETVRTTLHGADGLTVTVRQSRAPVDAGIRDTWLLIAAIAGLAVLAAVVLAVRQANRLAGPLVDLAETAERLGSGEPPARGRHYRVPELDRVAEVLDGSAERISRMLTAERRLAADASHQLRTPLTALSMRLEEIAETVDDDPTAAREEAAVALEQVERLTDVVQRLLTNSRDPRGGSEIAFDLESVIRQQTEEWRPAVDAAGRRIVREGPEGLRVVGTPGTVAQVLAALIENALMHGGGTVTLRTRTAANSAVLEVADEGPGVPPELGARVFERAVSGQNSTGLGLAVARDLAEADGGRLELVRMAPPIFAMFLGGQADESQEHAEPPPAADPSPQPDPSPQAGQAE